jgi:hypothetical protein
MGIAIRFADRSCAGRLKCPWAPPVKVASQCKTGLLPVSARGAGSDRCSEIPSAASTIQPSTGPAAPPFPPTLSLPAPTGIGWPDRPLSASRITWGRQSVTSRETHPYRRFPTMIRSGNVPKPHQKGRNVEDHQRESPIFTPILPWGHDNAGVIMHSDLDRRRPSDGGCEDWTGIKRSLATLGVALT